jgi:hypothetical protein
VKALAWSIAIATLVAAGVYTVVSLARWEWSRALFVATVFVAAEVILATGLVLVRLARLEDRLLRLQAAPRSVAGQALHDTRSQQQRFAWLRTDPDAALTRTNVFVTLLVGGGVVLSGGAWLLDRLASRTVDPPREAVLARQLDSIAYRPGLVVDEVNALARPRLERDDPGLDAFLEPGS